MGGCLFFGDEMPLKKLAGISVAMTGIVWYSQVRPKSDPSKSGSMLASISYCTAWKPQTSICVQPHPLLKALLDWTFAWYELPACLELASLADGSCRFAAEACRLIIEQHEGGASEDPQYNEGRSGLSYLPQLDQWHKAATEWGRAKSGWLGGRATPQSLRRPLAQVCLPPMEHLPNPTLCPPLQVALSLLKTCLRRFSVWTQMAQIDDHKTFSNRTANIFARPG